MTTMARLGKGAKVGIAIGAIAAVIDVAADGGLTIKLVQASSVSAKVVEERTVAFGEE